MKKVELDAKQFKKFQALIYEMSGIHVPDSKKTLLCNRLRRRLTKLDISNVDQYYRILKTEIDKQESQAFLDAITTNETSFFRSPKHFEWLGVDFLEDLIRRGRSGKHARQIKIWSAACSTGEEAYSIGITILENQLRIRGWEVQIIASDLSYQTLVAAKSGLFPPKKLDSLDPKISRRYFREMPDGNYHVKPKLAELISFRRHNLLEPWTGPRFDCIFLRNVMIYFDRKSKTSVVKRLQNALNPGGYLVLGPSEGVYDLLPDMQKISTFVYQKRPIE